MPDRVFFPLVILAALLAIGLAAIWPQGLGARSPGPFGHTPLQQTPEMQAAAAREQAQAAADEAHAREAAQRAEAAAAAAGR